MKNNIQEPTPEAKALSLFLMAYKSTSTAHKDSSKRINKFWRLVTRNEMSTVDYLKEVKQMLDFYGGYKSVVEKTVQFYIKKTGAWKLKGNDKYCKDAKKVAEKLLSK
jgi:hypothetical protein